MGLFGNGQGLQFGKSKPGENHRLSPANKGKECYFIEKKEVEKGCLEGMAAGGRGEFGLQVVMSSRGLGLPLDRRTPLLLLERRVLSSCRSVIGVLCRCLRAPPSGRPAPL